MPETPRWREQGTDGRKEEGVICLRWGWRENTVGPGPRGCVKREKVAERKSHFERQERI